MGRVEHRVDKLRDLARGGFFRPCSILVLGSTFRVPVVLALYQRHSTDSLTSVALISTSSLSLQTTHKHRELTTTVAFDDDLCHSLLIHSLC